MNDWRRLSIGESCRAGDVKLGHVGMKKIGRKRGRRETELEIACDPDVAVRRTPPPPTRAHTLPRVF